MSIRNSIEVRQVWKHNLNSEMNLIHQLLPRFPIASMDTEFPGTIFRYDIDKSFLSHLTPFDNYYLMKTNVNALNIIQVGLTLSDTEGKLSPYVWEFNFRDFNIATDDYNTDSIELLEKQGIDFESNRERGISSRCFADLCVAIGLIGPCSSVTWVTFHGSYDLGFFIKIVTQDELPDELEEFMELLHYYFGDRVYDLKHIIKFCDGLYGGLERVANALDVHRATGKSHQAGSDSLLTSDVFFEILTSFFAQDVTEDKGYKILEEFSGVLFGLEIQNY